MAKQIHRHKKGTQHSFARIPTVGLQRSQFDRSYTYSSAIHAGKLYPVFIQEALPGDTMNLNTIAFARFVTLLHPIFTNVYMDIQYFSVPHRLVWDNWERFCGAQDDPGDSIDFTVPQMDAGAGGFSCGSLQDFMGVPPVVPDLLINTLPNRCYNLIWNQWYRAQELQDSVVVDKDNGPDDKADYVTLPRGKRHDYFTSCLIAPQRGDGIVLPLGGTAPIIGFGKSDQTFTLTSQASYETGKTGTVTYADATTISTGANQTFVVEEDPNNAGFPNIRADLTNATAATINQLRQAMAIQGLLERDARGGTRYSEVLLSHFKVTTPDFRVQRPEYLGGGTTPITINQVAETSSTGNVGDLGAFGQALGSMGFTHSFTEHCTVIGLASIRADLTYQQGLERMWSRETRYDYFWPELAHLGEQVVKNKEIYAVGSAVAGQDDLAFGYQERWAEYRYSPSFVTGNFRSVHPTTLDTWHLSQDFSALPVLGDTFIQENPPLTRVIAVQGTPAFRVDFYHSLKHARPIPTYSVPGLGNRF